MRSNLLPFGINKYGDLVAVNEVENGIACECTCPACGGSLVARQGKVNAWNFAHHKETNCTAGYETALHLAVKHLIERERKLLLPGCVVWLNDRSTSKYEYRTESNRNVEEFVNLGDGVGIISTSKEPTQFDSVELEKFEGGITPDIVATIKNQRIYIEVAVTHYVDSFKLEKIRERGVSTLEISISYNKTIPWTWESLEDLLWNQIENKRWLLNVKVEKLAEIDRLSRMRKLPSNRSGYLNHFRFRVDLLPGEELFEAGGDHFDVLVSLNDHFITASADPVTGVLPKFRPKGIQLFFDACAKLGARYNPKNKRWYFSTATTHENYVNVAEEFYTSMEKITRVKIINVSTRNQEWDEVLLKRLDSRLHLQS